VPVALRRCENIGSSTGRTIHYELHSEVTAHPAHSEENEIWRQRWVEVHVLYPVVPQTPVDFVHNGKELRNIGFTTGTTHRHCRSRQNQLCNLLNTNSVSTDAVNVETLVRRKFADVVAQTPCDIAEDNRRAGVRHPNSVRVNLRQHDNGSARTDPGNSLNHAGRQDNRRARNLELRLRIRFTTFRFPDNRLGHAIIGSSKLSRNGNLMMFSRGNDGSQTLRKILTGEHLRPTSLRRQLHPSPRTINLRKLPERKLQAPLGQRRRHPKLEAPDRRTTHRGSRFRPFSG
jgi:hypothetical protein